MRASEIERLPPAVHSDKAQYVLLLGRCHKHKNPNYLNPLYVPAHLVILVAVNNELPEIICASEFEEESSVYVTEELLQINEHFLPESPATSYFRREHDKFNAIKSRGPDDMTESLLFVGPRIAAARHVGHPFWQQKLLGFIHDERQTLLQNVYSLSLRLNSLQSTEGVIIQHGLDFKGAQ